MQYQSDPNLPRLIGYALIAPRIKVMYVPTPKVAYSSLKLLIAQIEGSYNEAATREIITPNISQEQTIHNYRVHGLKRMRELSPEKQWEVIQSPDWLRIAALRDPLKRTYSSWENRVFLRAPGTPQQILDVCSDVLIDGRVDVAATFAKFARAISADRDAFALVDDHFRPQFNTLYSDQLEYHEMIRIDQHGEMQRLANVLNQRGGTNVLLQRLNSGLGITPNQVYTKEIADLIERTFHEDFEWFHFARHSYTNTHSSFVLDPLQQALLSNLRDTSNRIVILSHAAYKRVGLRYGVRQVGKSLWLRITRSSKRRNIQAYQ
ncbi:MAG: sulfotransferase family 2 domain-containing protein [Ilumatobacteraceae bacterium]|nr:sulfotransferase family 2 domain-containing protein [Ilumatobacteraceae bacterium]MDP4703417.1 sulfotransferase family 2 domain-containing protein [Ilumatobacteraceae bacterium]